MDFNGSSIFYCLCHSGLFFICISEFIYEKGCFDMGIVFCSIFSHLHISVVLLGRVCICHELCLIVDIIDII